MTIVLLLAFGGLVSGLSGGAWLAVVRARAISKDKQDAGLSNEPVRQLVQALDWSEERQSKFGETDRFLLAIVMQLLPQWKRARYLEEFLAELQEVPHNRRLRHALSLLRGVFVLRLQGSAKDTAAATAVRKAKD